MGDGTWHVLESTTDTSKTQKPARALKVRGVCPREEAELGRVDARIPDGRDRFWTFYNPLRLGCGLRERLQAQTFKKGAGSKDFSLSSSLAPRMLYHWNW